MKVLAKGNNQEITESIIKHLLNSTQGSQFETFLDEEAIKDIADVVQVEGELFNKDEMATLNQSHAIQVKDDRDIDLEDCDASQSDNLSRAQ